MSRIIIALLCVSDTHATVEHLMQIQDGPLAGIKAMQSTIGEYTVDNDEPTKQKVRLQGMRMKSAVVIPPLGNQNHLHGTSGCMVRHCC